MAKRLLVLDDEALIAWGIATEMEFLGWDIVDVVGTADGALSLIDAGTVEAGLLDFNLRGETSEAVARQMIALGLPFLFISGAIPESFPSFGRPIEVLTKPVDYRKASNLLRQLAGEGAGTPAAPQAASGTTIFTQGDQSSGIVAQSIGGGGGNGGFAAALAGSGSGLALGAAVGGSGSAGGRAGTVDVVSWHNIVTWGDQSHGIVAQSLGGGDGSDGGAGSLLRTRLRYDDSLLS